MKKPTKPPAPTTRNWDDLFRLCPLGPSALAAKVGVTRQALHNLQHGVHRRLPVVLLGNVAEVMRAQGMSDGSPPPTREELVRSWREAFDGTKAGGAT